MEDVKIDLMLKYPLTPLRNLLRLASEESLVSREQ